MRRIHMLISFVLGFSLVAGCTVGPEYQRPEIDTGTGWIEPTRDTEREVDLAAWWRSFEDPVLDSLIEKELERNIDVRQAELRITEARALRAAAAGGRYPSVAASAGITQRRQSENGPFPITQIPGIERDQTIYEPGFDAIWELDLFGRTRRAVEAADARVDAASESARGVRLTMAGELARSYFVLRGAQHELEARGAAIAASTAAVDLMRRRLEAGDLPEAELAQAEAELAAATAEIPLIEAQARGAALAIGSLLGGLPETGLELVGEPAGFAALAPFPIGERADLLRRRPDVRAAERALAATTAEVGIATAELFPRITIGASGGFQALDTGSLFDSGSQTFAIAPLISWRIFDGGRIRAQINAAEARVQYAALDYEKAVIQALADAERALLRYDAGLDALELQRASLAAAQRSYDHAEARYGAGDISRLELLRAESQLRDVERAYARVHTQAATDLVALCKALGGSWAEAAANG
jgi:NodT family efflux transporter outer membrane factor (OMF) lipoprotein